MRVYVNYIVIEWFVLYTLLALETDSFTVSEHKTKILVACQNMLHLYLSKRLFTITCINVTVHIHNNKQ